MLAVAFAIRGLKEFGDTSRKALIISYSIRNVVGKWWAPTISCGI